MLGPNVVDVGGRGGGAAEEKEKGMMMCASPGRQKAGGLGVQAAVGGFGP